jgi:hypothetical protein
MKIKEPLEKDIQKAILDFLEWQKNIYFFRAGAGAVKTIRGNGSTGYFKTGKKGLPDIILLINGYFIGLEVKRPSGVQSEAQKSAQDDIEVAGGKYFLVRSIDDVEKIIKEYKNKKNE